MRQSGKSVNGRLRLHRFMGCDALKPDFNIDATFTLERDMTFVKSVAVSAAMTLAAGAAFAETEITWWHAMGGSLGETVNAIATQFNDAYAGEYKITPIYKGSYEDILTAGIAAFPRESSQTSCRCLTQLQRPSSAHKAHPFPFRIF